MVYRAVAGLCLAALGGVTGRHVGTGWLPIAAFAGAGAVVALLFLTLLGGLLFIANGAVRKKLGGGVLGSAAAKSSLLLVPFTLLALLAELYLGWNAVQPFLTAALMTAAGYAGSEAIRLGGGRLTNALATALAGFVLAGLWLALIALGGAAWRW